MSPFAVAAIVLVVIVGWLLVTAFRRRQANRVAAQLGGRVVTGALPYPAQSGYAPPRGDRPPPGAIGSPNPALPPPQSVDHRTGIVTRGQPVELQICGLPALVWQRSEHWDGHYQPMQLHLIVDTAIGLPFLQMYARGFVSRALTGPEVTTGVEGIDEAFRVSGDIAAWRPVLGAPGVQHALLTFPLHSVNVYGGRIAFESKDGVHLDPGASAALAGVAAALIGAIPPQITSAASAPPITAVAGAHVGDAEGMVREVLARQNLSPQQQDALMQLMRAAEQRRRAGD